VEVPLRCAFIVSIFTLLIVPCLVVASIKKVEEAEKLKSEKNNLLKLAKTQTLSCSLDSKSANKFDLNYRSILEALRNAEVVRSNEDDESKIIYLKYARTIENELKLIARTTADEAKLLSINVASYKIETTFRNTGTVQRPVYSSSESRQLIRTARCE
jgi:hypothetical protein